MKGLKSYKKLLKVIKRIVWNSVNKPKLQRLGLSKLVLILNSSLHPSSCSSGLFTLFQTILAYYFLNPSLVWVLR